MIRRGIKEWLGRSLPSWA